MRAMGFYPTEFEVKCMIDEVRQEKMSTEGLVTMKVEMNTFIKLFVNHRPVYGIGKNNIEEAFRVLIDDEKLNSLSRDELITYLST